MVFFARSDWLLKLEIVTAIYLQAVFWILFVRFFLISQKKGIICCRLSTGLIYVLNQLFTSVSKNSGYIDIYHCSLLPW